MNCTASSYFIPHSMRAKATRTGALRGAEIQKTPFKKRAKRESKGGEREKRRLNVIVHMVQSHWVEARGGGLNLGNKPGKLTGVHKFTIALLGH